MKQSGYSGHQSGHGEVNESYLDGHSLGTSNSKSSCHYFLEDTSGWLDPHRLLCPKSQLRILVVGHGEIPRGGGGGGCGTVALWQ